MDENEVLVTEVAPKHGGSSNNNMISRPLKYCLLAFSLLFWLTGSLFIAIGGWTISQKTGYEEVTDFTTDPGCILAALGTFVFAVSAFGVLGALRENVCCLRMFKMFLVLTLAFELSAGIITFAYWPQVKTFIQGNMNTAIEKYTVNPDLRNLIDTMQREMECCGSVSINDWDANEFFSCHEVSGTRHCGVPWSCCLKKFQPNRLCGYGLRKTQSHFKLENEIYTRGCLDVGFTFFRSNMFVIGGIAVAFTLPLIVGILMTTVLMKQIRNQVESFGAVTHNKLGDIAQ